MAKRGVNKVILVGNLGDFPEVRYSQQGEAIVNFSMATGEAWTDKNTGQPQERTEWHRCCAFGKLAEICARLLQKGTKVYVEGTLRTRKYTDQQGIERYSTQIYLDELQVLKDGITLEESRHDSNPNPSTSPQQQNPPAPPQRGGPPQPPGNYYQRTQRAGPPPDARYNANGTQQSPYANVPDGYTPPPGGFDDDIPF